MPLALALAIAGATHYLDQPAVPRQSRNPPPRRTLPSAPSAPGSQPAKGEESALEPPGPIVSADTPAPAPPGPAAARVDPLVWPFDRPAEAREIPRLMEEMGRPVAVVSAQVIDPAGRPIPGVQVQLGEREAVTDSQGEAVLPLKPADLTLRHPDFFPRVIDPELRRGIALPDHETSSERVIVVLFPGGRVAGKVEDPGGKAVVGAQVAFDGDETPAATTDARGEFKSPILRPGIHHLLLMHPDHQRADGPVTIPPGGGEVAYRATLKPGVPLELRTVDAAGAPVPDASVWLVRREAGGAEESRSSGRTGDEGRLTLLWHPADPHWVRVLAPGYREAVQPLSGKSVVVVLDRAPLLAGQVIDRERGLPVRPRELVLEIETPEGFRRAPDRGILFRTLAAGKYRVGLPPFPGAYRVRAMAEGDLSGASDVVHFDGQTEPPPAIVHLDRRTGLRGQVVAQGGAGGAVPVPAARVELYRHDPTEALRLAYGVWFAAPPLPVRTGTSDAAGGFSFADLKSAAYRVRVLHPSYAEWLSAPLNVPLEAPLPCALGAPATLRGTVLGAEGTPEAGIPLVLASQSHPFTRFGRSDEGGRYEFRNLAEGSYLLFTGDPRAEGGPSVETWGSAPPSLPRGGSQAVEIHGGSEVVFDVRRAAGFRGGLWGKVSTDGAPLAGVPLRLIPPADAAPPEPEIEVTTGPDGGFRVEGLEPGTYRIAGGNLPVEETVQVAGGRTSELTIGLKTFSYRASLLDGLSGKPLEALGRAEISPDRGPAGADKGQQPGTAVRDLPVEAGRIAAAGLYAGKYLIRIAAQGYVAYQGSFVIPPDLPGGCLSQEIRLRPGKTLRVAVLGTDEQPFHGVAETVLLRAGVEIHRSYGPVEGEVLLPVLADGSYTLTIRSDAGSTRMSLEVNRDDAVRARLGKKPAE